MWSVALFDVISFLKLGYRLEVSEEDSWYIYHRLIPLLRVPFLLLMTTEILEKKGQRNNVWCFVADC